MSTKRSSFRPEFKFKVAMEVASGQATLNEIASKYKIHPNQISRWKKHLLDEGASLFTDGRSKRTKETDSAEKIDQLYQEVGRLQVSLNWYKKKHGIVD